MFTQSLVEHVHFFSWPVSRSRGLGGVGGGEQLLRGGGEVAAGLQQHRQPGLHAAAGVSHRRGRGQPQVGVQLGLGDGVEVGAP